MVNPEILKEVGIDYEAGVKHFMDDSEFYEKILTIFTKENALTDIKKAYESGDMETLLNLVHDIKGSSGNSDLTDIYITSSNLVVVLRKESYTKGELDDAYNRFTEVYAKVFDGIKRALA